MTCDLVRASLAVECPPSSANPSWRAFSASKTFRTALDPSKGPDTRNTPFLVAEVGCGVGLGPYPFASRTIAMMPARIAGVSAGQAAMLAEQFLHAINTTFGILCRWDVSKVVRTVLRAGKARRPVFLTKKAYRSVGPSPSVGVKSPGRLGYVSCSRDITSAVARWRRSPAIPLRSAPPFARPAGQSHRTASVSG